MMDKAHQHLQAGELEAAEDLYRAETENNPDNAEAFFMLAEVRKQRGDLDDALDLLRTAERLEPFNPNIFHARAVLHIARKESEDASHAFQQALDINPNHLPSRNGLAFIELAAGRFEAAEHAADQVLSEDPENAQALTYKGTAVLELGKPKEAMVYLQEALRLEPEALTAQAQLGRAFLTSGNAAFAAQCFENALQKAPGSADLLEFLGRSQLEMGEVIPALKPLREAASKGRANPELFHALAACETAAGNPGQAEGLLAAAVQMTDPAEGPREDLVLPLAELLIARGATDGALAALDTLAQAGVDNETLDVLISQAQLRAGNTAAAIAAIQPRCNRANASVAARLAYVQALEADGREAMAAELLDELLAEDPPSADVLFYRAKRWFDAGDPAAVDALQDLVNRPGLSTQRLLQIRRLLAEALHRAERYPEAAGQYAALAHRSAEILSVDSDFVGSGVDPTTAMDPAVTAGWPREAPGDNRPDPVFVIGWPGSGQERVLPALDAHSALRMVMDPSPNQAKRRAHIDRPRGAEALAGLDDAQIQLRRGRYWKALDALGVKPGDQTVLDVMWLSVEALPTVARLFPGARVIVVTRDPRDMSVAWMMSGYRDLGDMARYYGNQLALLARCREALPLEFVDVDYDAVEADPAGELAKLQQALGLEPERAVTERFDEVPLPVPVTRGVYEKYAGERSGDTESAPGSDAVH